MRRILALLVVAAAVLVGTAGRSQAGQYISMGTSSAGGTFAIIGTAIADAINRTVPEVSVNIEVTGGSAENIFLVAQNNTEFGMSASDVVSLALEGKGSFEGKKVEGFVGVMGGHLTAQQVYVLADSPYRSYADLKGKRISVGPAGSVGNDSMRIAMEAYGLKMGEDWTPEFLSHGDGAEALTDGNVDAVCIMSTIPAAPVSAAAASKPIRLLSMDKDKLDGLLAACPFYVPSRVPQETYNGMDADCDYTFASAAMLLCNKDLPEDLVYNVVKSIYTNLDTLVKAYPQCDEWNPDNAYRGLEGLVEVHPGTVKYLKEIGKAK